MTQPEVFELIVAERKRQAWLQKMGKFKHTLDTAALPFGSKLAILVEEVGEVARAICEHSPREHLRDELIQVAALTVAWVEGLDV